jgi:hypothetical protein
MLHCAHTIGRLDLCSTAIHRVLLRYCAGTTDPGGTIETKKDQKKKRKIKILIKIHLWRLIGRRGMPLGEPRGGGDISRLRLGCGSRCWSLAAAGSLTPGQEVRV